MTPTTTKSVKPLDQEIDCSEEEGRLYRAGVYQPLDDGALPEVDDGPSFPARGSGPRYRLKNEIPRVPQVRHLIGPSVIALGMGLGAGEFLLWPNLIAVNGFSIWWLFWVGVLTQFVVIAEIERWTIATGESVFGGMARLGGRAFWPWFFLVATLVAFFWPGWASQSGQFTAEIVREATGVSLAWQPIALFMMGVIWLGLAVSKIVYNALERFEIGLVLAFFPMLAVALIVAGFAPRDLLALIEGAVVVGRVPDELLSGAQFPTLLIAVAYAGSGGTLLLAQSLWIRDKGFGMASYQGRIAGIRGANEDISRTGYVFDATAEPLMTTRYRRWIRVATRELFWTFFVLIILSVVVTTLLVSSTIGVGDPALAGDLSGMVTAQADALQRSGGTWLKMAFLMGGAFVLFSTQVGIVDTVTRISGTIFYERYGRNTTFWTLKRTFLSFLTLAVVASMAIIVVSWVGGEAVEGLQPDFLVLIAGPFTIASMYAFALVIGYMNARRLPRALAPALWRRVGMVWAAILWGWFTAEQISRTVLSLVDADPATVHSIAPHPVRIGLYAMWVGSVVWFAVATLGRGRG